MLNCKSPVVVTVAVAAALLLLLLLVALLVLLVLELSLPSSALELEETLPLPPLLVAMLLRILVRPLSVSTGLTPQKLEFKFVLL
jgi:hypothetical protein